MSQPYLLVRLRPVDPYTPGRRIYTMLKRPGIPVTLKFEEQKGWHKLPRSVGEVLRNETDSEGAAVFDVCTHEEAIKVEIAEEQRRSQKAQKAKASAPHAMSVLTAKSARDLEMEPPPVKAPVAAPVTPRAPKMPAPAEIVAAESIDWEEVEQDTRHPAAELQDERDADDDAVSPETVDLSAPPPTAASDDKAAKKRRTKRQ